MAHWNLADCLDEIAAIRGSEPALVQGPRRLGWSEVERRARNLAAWMIERGASHQAKVALYSYNHPAYMEGVWAAMKAALAPVNVNYRYRAEELRYLLENADAEFVIVHQDFAPCSRRCAATCRSCGQFWLCASRAPAPRPSRSAAPITRRSPTPTAPPRR